MRHEVGPGVHLGPSFGGRGCSRGSVMVPFERAMVVSYRLSIVTIALSLTIQSQNVICHRMSLTLQSTGGGSLSVEFGEEEVD